MAQNETDPAALLQPAEAAELMGVQLSTLARWRRLKMGPPPVKLGYRTIRYRRAAVDAFIAAREREDG